MNLMEFIRWNLVIIAVLLLIVVLYLVGLINRRRRAKFLHKEPRPGKRSKASTPAGGA